MLAVFYLDDDDDASTFDGSAYGSLNSRYVAPHRCLSCMLFDVLHATTPLLSRSFPVLEGDASTETSFASSGVQSWDDNDDNGDPAELTRLRVVVWFWEGSQASALGRLVYQQQFVLKIINMVKSKYKTLPFLFDISQQHEPVGFMALFPVRPPPITRHALMFDGCHVLLLPKCFCVDTRHDM